MPSPKRASSGKQSPQPRKSPAWRDRVGVAVARVRGPHDRWVRGCLAASSACWERPLPRLREARDEMTWSVHTVAAENVSATLAVAVPAARVFAVLADPATHSAIDGTGWVQEAVNRAPLTEVGQIFRMNMYHPNHPDGDYQMANKVQVLEPPRAIGWLPGRTPRATVTWSSAAGSGVTTWRRSVRPRLRSRSPTTGRRCRSSSGTGASSSRRSALSISPTRCTTWPRLPHRRPGPGRPAARHLAGGPDCPRVCCAPRCAQAGIGTVTS